MTFRYHVCGLNIRSQIELPELTGVDFDCAPDVSIEYADLGLVEGASQSLFEFSVEKQVFVYPQIAAFSIEQKHRILVEPANGAASNLVALPLLGPVLALIVHMHGRFVIHASALNFCGAGVGFMGVKGAGKSTLAAHLLLEDGTTLLSDDLLVLNDQLEILPSFAQMNLLPDALEQVTDLRADRRPPALDGLPKTQLRMAHAALEHKPLDVLFELHRSHDPRIEDLSIPEALKVITNNTYIGRFATRAIVPEERQAIFRSIVQVVNSCAVKRLYVPSELVRLREARAVLRDYVAEHLG